MADANPGSHEDIWLVIILTASIMIIHNFLIDMNDDLNIYLNSHHEMDTEHDVPENKDDDDYDGKDEDMSTCAILLRYIQYINEN